MFAYIAIPKLHCMQYSGIYYNTNILFHQLVNTWKDRTKSIYCYWYKISNYACSTRVTTSVSFRVELFASLTSFCFQYPPDSANICIYIFKPFKYPLVDKIIIKFWTKLFLEKCFENYVIFLRFFSYKWCWINDGNAPDMNNVF